MGEPMMKVDVTTPEEHMGDVIGDVNSRRGMVVELADRGNMKVVRAKVPLANMFQYVSSLRSLTKGRASYSMELESYEPVPPNVEKEIMSKYKGNTGEDEEASTSIDHASICCPPFSISLSASDHAMHAS